MSDPRPKWSAAAGKAYGELTTKFQDAAIKKWIEEQYKPSLSEDPMSERTIQETQTPATDQSKGAPPGDAGH